MSKRQIPATPLPRSDILPTLRHVVNAVARLKQLIGPVAEFHLVVDANVLIADLRWIFKKRHTANARTNLQECIAAGTIIAYVTPTVVGEVEEKLALMAADGGLSEAVWRPDWARYKSMLRIVEPGIVALERNPFGRDPDDAPNVALADMLSADGILTNDTDIAGMGGTAISVGFVIQARDYSRKAAVSVSIQVGGYYLVVGTRIAVNELAKALRHGAARFQALPVGVKILVLLAVLCVVLHPRSRNSIASTLKAIGRSIPDVLPQILQAAFSLACIAAENETSPPMLPAPRRAAWDRLS